MAPIDANDREAGGTAGNRLAVERRSWQMLLYVAATVFVAAWCGIEMTRGLDRIVSIWLANAVLLSVLLKVPAIRWPALMLVGYLANVAANLVTGDDLLLAAALPLCNTLEVAICALPIRFFGWKVNFTQASFLVKFGALALLPAPAAAALVGAGLLHLYFGLDFATVFISWYPADALGLIAITPVLMVTRKEEFIALFERPRILRTGLVLVVVLVANAVVFYQGTLPLLFLVYPGLLFATFQLGFVGAVVSIAITTAISVAATVGGSGPLSLLHGTGREQVLVFQIFLAGAVLMNLIVSAVLAERARLVNALRSAKMAAECSEAERVASESLLAVTLESMDQGLMIIGPDDSIPVCNRRALDLLDLPAKFMAGQPSYAQILAFQMDRGDYDSMSEDVQALVANPPNAPAPIVFERTQSNGRVIETRSNSLPTGGVVRTYTDISTRRAAERRLGEREYLYRLLAENTTDVISRLRLDGICTYASPASTQVLGYPPHKVANRPYLALVVPEDRPAAAEVFRRMVEGEVDVGMVNFRLRHPDGRIVHVDASLKLIRHPESGQPLEIVATGRDVTQREEHAVEVERAREAAEEARVRAEQANEAKSNFIASMSHEIRTPLNSIIGFAGIILDRSNLHHEVKRQIGLIQNAATALLTVVNDILDFSKIEADQLTIDPRPFSPLVLIDNMVSIVRTSAENKKLVMSTRLSPGLPDWVVGDDGRIGQVLLNLLNNAVKFTESGSVSLTIMTEAIDLNRVSMSFEIADTGIGIAEENLERLFVRFSQIDGSIQRRYGGTGLGLAICKRLVELMGGTLGVESREGTGSIFWFRIPLTLSAAPDIVAGRDSTETPRPGRILLAEDLDMNQEIAATLLHGAGHSVKIVGDGQQAVEAAAKEPFDVILMDVQMPGMDGITATRQIRSFAGKAGKVPIVALTANVLANQIARFKEAGMNDHIGKPFDKFQLYRVVSRWIGEGSKPEAISSRPVDDDFDQAAYEEIKSLFEADKLAHYLDTLRGMLSDIVGEAADQKDIVQRAHKLVSTAGMLGFRRIADLAVALENACEEGDDIGPLLAELRRAADVATSRMDGLRAAA